MTLLSTVIGRGTHASRPAAGTAGEIYYETDTFLFFRDNGSSWDSILPPGTPVLIYRYTVTGSVKASIDTGVDTANAGSNDWTNGDLLEVYLYARTDEAVVTSSVNLTLNNDTGANYSRQFMAGNNSSSSIGAAASQSNINMQISGASHAANFFSATRIVIPNFTGTVGDKTFEIYNGNPDTTNANQTVYTWAATWASTSAVTRLAIAPATGGKNFAVGTQLLIYKRLAS